MSAVSATAPAVAEGRVPVAGAHGDGTDVLGAAEHIRGHVVLRDVSHAVPVRATVARRSALMSPLVLMLRRNKLIYIVCDLRLRQVRHGRERQRPQVVPVEHVGDGEESV